MTQDEIKNYRFKHLGIAQEDNASEKAFKFKLCPCGKHKIFFFRNLCDECFQQLLSPILKQR